MNQKTLSEQAGKKEAYNGDFVLRNQETHEAFTHVSKSWLDKTLTFEQVLAKGREFQAQFKDVEGLRLSDLRSAAGLLSADRIGMLQTTKHSLRQVCTFLGLPPDYIEFLSDADQTLHAQNFDAAVKRAVRADEQHKAAVEQASKIEGASRPPRPDHSDREVFLRLRATGGAVPYVLRAALSSKYAVINNLPVIETLADIVPGGRVSHLHYDGDTFRANILIPDSVRTEDDSDYGGGISTLNNETGRTQFRSRPFVFRAICMNGNIWDRADGVEFNRRHLGTINWAQFRATLVENIQRQIPLVQKNIEKVLALKGLPVTEQEIQQAIVYVGRKERLTQGQQREWWGGFNVERSAGNVAQSKGKTSLFSAFGIVQGLTRGAQTQEFEARELMESLSAKLIDGNWDRLLSAARNDVSPDQAKEALSLAA